MNRSLPRLFCRLAAAVAILVLVGCSSPEEKAESYYQSGQAYLEKQDYARASIEFRNALKVKKDHVGAWFGMAQIEEKAQNWSSMVGDLNKVIELNPGHLKAYLSLAKFYLAAQDFPSALKNANIAYEKDPNNPDIISLRAVVLLKLDDRSGAKAEAEKAIKINANHVDANIVLASLQIDSGNLAAASEITEKALASNPDALGLYLVKLKIAEKQNDLAAQEAVIRAIIKAFPDHKEYRSGLISFLVKNNRPDDAEKELRNDLAANPKDQDAANALVKLLTDTKGLAAARAQLEELAKTAENPFDYLIQIADIDFANGDKDQSFANLRNLIAKYGISDEGIGARLDLAGKLLSEKQLSEAEALTTEVLKNDSLNATGLKLKGALELAKGNQDAAIELLRQALNNNANDAEMRVLLASAYESKASYDLAVKEFSDAYKLSNGDADVGLNFANYLLRRGNVDRAEDVLSEIISRYPNNNDVLTALANIKLRKQDWKGAEELARMIQDSKGSSALSNQILGASMMGQKRFNDAITFFQTSIASAPQDTQPMFALVRSYISAGKTGEAEAFVQSMLKANQNNASAHILMGIVQLAQNNSSAAQQSFESAVAMAPTDPTTHLALAQFYYDEKKTDQSIAVLTAAIEKVKANSGLRLVLAGIYESNRVYDKAIEQYQAVVDSDPTSAVAINNLVSLVGDTSTDAATIARAAQLATPLKNAPIPQFRESYGWIMVVDGKPREGLPVLEETISKLDQFSLAHYHIGVAYAKIGEKNLASQHLKQALNLEKSPDGQQKISKAIDALNSGTL